MVSRDALYPIMLRHVGPHVPTEPRGLEAEGQSMGTPSTPLEIPIHDDAREPRSGTPDICADERVGLANEARKVDGHLPQCRSPTLRPAHSPLQLVLKKAPKAARK